MLPAAAVVAAAVAAVAAAADSKFHMNTSSFFKHELIICNQTISCRRWRKVVKYFPV